jgi:hypothetical protein
MRWRYNDAPGIIRINPSVQLFVCPVVGVGAPRLLSPWLQPCRGPGALCQRWQWHQFEARVCL